MQKQQSATEHATMAPVCAVVIRGRTMTASKGGTLGWRSTPVEQDAFRRKLRVMALAPLDVESQGYANLIEIYDFGRCRADDTLLNFDQRQNFIVSPIIAATPSRGESPAK
ncbi:hypothetical protein K9U39_17660 [Rhodoblastus acidophilus]|uniref:Uncharacterized protein n=1 Tax=Candidatus Rhodoblastus alkanivorans TaxID=2954117 RepID=A0ABS9Z248_9HYPH|nr:hypothetical protein [Candidatus Rhodoblastus alkanivorans]MCI4679052.1 hypothetical protein [Candidatus Rhodoblastus alkanivorans]MCI4681693.1 hypothetical protein [Candidatus Rhodoblastus alkanivorans]MDI4642741.1 hypothetical protein [Rhodoblastus acidophilus]